MRMFALFGLAGAATLLAACAVDVLNDKPEVEGVMAPQTFTLSGDEVSGRVDLQIGDRIELRLPANPSTGYQWTFDTNGGAAVLIEKAYIADPAPEGLVGSGGTRVFVFEQRPGPDTEISLRYARSGGDVAETRMVKIQGR